MPLSLTVDSLDTIPEALRDAYTEVDGKFRLQVDGLEAIERKAGKATQYEKEAIERRKALGSWESLGKSPDDIKAIMEAYEAAEAKRAESEARREEAERKKAEQEGDFKTLLKKQSEDLAKFQDAAKKEAERLSQALAAEAKAREAAQNSERGAVMSTRLVESLARLGATEEGLKALPRLLADRIKYNPDANGDARFQFLLSDGETPLPGKDEKPATWADIAQDAATEFPSLFRGSGAGGGGKSPNSNAGGTGNRTMTRSEFNRLDPASQMKAMTGPAEERIAVVE